ncbi:hypothetical protein HYX17_00295 [Candidatus Woesearchaeota archaeon]|nr:hypothetical protein [Candidatus Woesearchaeota archaeon]
MPSLVDRLREVVKEKKKHYSDMLFRDAISYSKTLEVDGELSYHYHNIMYQLCDALGRYILRDNRIPVKLAEGKIL